jgi:hypothetical protein
MRSRSLISALSLVVLLAACRDETNTGGRSEGGNPSDGGSPSNGGGGNPPADGGAGAGPSNGGGGQGAGAGPSNGGGGNGPQGGFGGNGGTGPQGGTGGEGGAPPAGENCIDGVDNDGDLVIDCLDSECMAQAVCGDLVINELDYDNIGADADEFIEIYNAGIGPIDLDGLAFIRVNGADGTVYGGATGIQLTGTLDADSYLVIASATVVVDPGATNVLLSGNIQNGNPDAVALYDANHQVVIDALAYGGAVESAVIDGLTFDLTPAAATTALDSNSQAVSLIRFPNGSDTNNDVTDWSATTIITPGADNQQGAVPETNCSDGVDNNGNGEIDCDDAACDGISCDANGSTCVTMVCTCPGGSMETACNDGLDNDCDGDIDCGDVNCDAAPICGEDCDDGIDNNGDTLVDCVDPVCAGQSCGPNGLTCAGIVCACPGGATESVCNDSIDNNCNGQTDCADTACSAAPSCTAIVFINEIHYDNAGTDAGEGVEIAATAGLDLTGYSIVHYNGSTGAIISTTALSGVVPNQSNGFGTVFFAIVPLQNDNEGLALVGPGNVVIQFLSYEGAVTATAGPATGMTAVLIPVSEASTPAGESLQLTGTYPAFTWAASATATPNAVNNAQTF